MDLGRKTHITFFENQVVKILFLGLCRLNDDFERFHLLCQYCVLYGPILPVIKLTFHKNTFLQIFLPTSLGSRIFAQQRPAGLALGSIFAQKRPAGLALGSVSSPPGEPMS